jgi:hypothetical protein
MTQTTRSTQQIDFTKPVELIFIKSNSESDDYKVLQVIFHDYQNPMYKNAVVIKHCHQIYLVGVDRHGNFSSDNYLFYEKYKLQNKKEVIKEIWVNLYKDGFVGSEGSSKSYVDSNKLHSPDRYGYYLTKEFSDGSFTNEVILIQE